MKLKTLLVSLGTIAALFLGTANASAVTEEDLYGSYTLTANGSLFNGMTGYQANSTVVIAEGTQDADLDITGLFGQPAYTVHADFDDETQTITFGFAVVGMTPTAEGVTMFAIGGVTDNQFDMMKQVTLNVAADGSISFTDHIGVGAITDIMTGQAMLLEAILGGKMERANVVLLDDDALVGEYTFKSATEPIMNDEFEAVFPEFTADNFKLTVKKDPEEGARHFLISGFYGFDSAVPAEYDTTTGKLVLETNMQFAEDDDTSYRLGTSADGSEYYLATIFANLEFEVSEQTLTTSTNMYLYFKASDESDYLDGQAATNNGGGVATKGDATAVSTVKAAGAGADSIYTLGGVRVKKGQKGLHIIRTAEGTKKVIL